MPGHYLMQNDLKLFLSILILSSSAFCQIEELKWKKADISYQAADQFNKREYSFQSENAGDFLSKSFVNAYWFFISDVDGDNCAFHPTCSSFFIEATEETNIFQGSLMLSDRLTRDLNPFKRELYPLDVSHNYFDPAKNYTLNQDEIIYMPPTYIVDDE